MTINKDDINSIENKIAHNDLSATQTFTQMRQLIDSLISSNNELEKENELLKTALKEMVGYKKRVKELNK